MMQRIDSFFTGLVLIIRESLSRLLPLNVNIIIQINKNAAGVIV